MVYLKRRAPMLLITVAIVLVVSACGRVNLEDLTPEAIRTQIASQPSPTAAPTRAAQQGSTPDPTARVTSGNLAAGYDLYNAQCSGCHGSNGQPGRRAESLHGKGLTFADAPWLLSGEGGPEGHPTYANIQVPLSENNLEDIFFYLSNSQ